jgi:hypothetical protein
MGGGTVAVFDSGGGDFACLMDMTEGLDAISRLSVAT